MIISAAQLFQIDNLAEYKMHFAVWNGEEHPLDVFVQDREAWKGWNSWRNRNGKDDFNRRFIFSIIRFYPQAERWLFGGIFEVLDRTPKDHYVIRLVKQGQEYIGRLLFQHPGPGVQGRAFLPETYYDQLKVIQIFEKPYDGEAFCGAESINHDFSVLESIFRQGRTDWKAALENVKGVYLVADKTNGRMYVGSAYGQFGIWARWSCYIETGHGWNDELTRLIRQKGIEYARSNFKFSILELFTMKTADGEVCDRESHWKKVLLSREFGYNRN